MLKPRPSNTTCPCGRMWASCRRSTALPQGSFQPPAMKKMGKWPSLSEAKKYPEKWEGKPQGKRPRESCLAPWGTVNAWLSGSAGLIAPLELAVHCRKAEEIVLLHHVKFKSCLLINCQAPDKLDKHPEMDVGQPASCSGGRMEVCTHWDEDGFSHGRTQERSRTAHAVRGATLAAPRDSRAALLDRTIGSICFMLILLRQVACLILSSIRQSCFLPKS